MLKNKLMVFVIGLSLTLAGCTSSNNKAGETGDANSAGSIQKSQQTVSDGDTGSNLAKDGPGNTAAPNQNEGKKESEPKSSNSSTAASNSPAPPVNDTRSQNLNMSNVTAVRLADFNTGWAGGDGWIAKTESGGKNWAIVYQGSGTVQQLFALNHSDVWAVINQNNSVFRLMHSSNGGLNWNLIGTLPNQAFLHFISNTTALSGNYLSDNGGRSWKALPIPPDMVGDAYFHDEKNGWAVTQRNNVVYINTTTDGGSTWRSVMTKNLSSSLTGAVIRSAGKNDAWIELIGSSGMTQTSYTVFHTTNGGASWRTVIANSTAGGGPAPGVGEDNTNGPVNKGSQPGPLYVVNPQVAFMGGACPACDIQNSIGWTKDGGKTWDNSTVTLEGSGNALLAMADSKHGWWITTETEKQSNMYVTSDGGIHWKKVHIFR